MDDYVAKPIRPNELREALQRAKPLRTKHQVSSNATDITFDAAALDNLKELGGEEFLMEVIDAFFADAPMLLAMLRRSVDGRDADELRRAAHTLKSNSATLGAERFSELCRELEQRARNGELEGASELVDRIEREYEPLREALVALHSTSAS